MIPMLLAAAHASPLCALGTRVEYAPAAALLAEADLELAYSPDRIGRYFPNLHAPVSMRFYTQDSPETLVLLGLDAPFRTVRKSAGWVPGMASGDGPNTGAVWERELRLGTATIGVKAWVYDKDQVIAVDARLFDGDAGTAPECAAALRTPWWTPPSGDAGREILREVDLTEGPLAFELELQPGPVELSAWSDVGRWTVSVRFVGHRPDGTHWPAMDLDPSVSRKWVLTVPGELSVWAAAEHPKGGGGPLHVALLRADDGTLVIPPSDAEIAAAEAERAHTRAWVAAQEERNRAAWQAEQDRQAAAREAEVRRAQEAMDKPQLRGALVAEGWDRQGLFSAQICLAASVPEDIGDAELQRMGDAAFASANWLPARTDQLYGGAPYRHGRWSFAVTDPHSESCGYRE
ncbi:MAG: hypothetical protein H6738_19695 [Alphaproteobacteria bacterium]|nr:hypothetical protein [Alphaproteobacteria bacterium]